jgi:hypothetical protein
MNKNNLPYTVHMKKILMLAAFLSLNFNSCVKENPNEKVTEEKTPPLFTLMSPEKTGFDFVNEIVNNKELNIFKYRNFYNGGGVAIGDINNDGLPDIYMTANMGPNKLFLNKGNLQFEEISEKA